MLILLFSAVALRDDQKPENVIAFLGSLSYLAASTAAWLKKKLDSDNTDTASSYLKRLGQRNRDKLLLMVEQYWIRGVLHNSLHERRLIQMMTTETPEAVDPVQYAVPLRDATTNELITDDILDIWYNTGDGLLILGQPGAGKTTMLLHLAESLIKEARRYSDKPIPVVFPLASWANERKPLNEWLVDELRRGYNVPSSVGEDWVAAGSILPLLDGLDEVAETHQKACVAAINTYQNTHGLNIVVCCRRHDYNKIGSLLHIQRAIEIQPLTLAQLETYLSRFDPEGQQLWQAIQSDEKLAQMATQPLMLFLLLSVHEPTTNRQSLYQQYINQALKSREQIQTYEESSAQRYLKWLARYMESRRQTTFYIGNLQPRVLNTEQREQYCNWLDLLSELSMGQLVGLVGGGALGLLFSLISGANLGLFIGSIGGMGLGLLFGIANRLTGGLALRLSLSLISNQYFRRHTAFYRKISPTEHISWSIKSLPSALWRNKSPILTFGMLGGLFFWTIDKIILGETGVWTRGTAFGTGYGLLFGAANILFDAHMSYASRPSGIYHSLQNYLKYVLASLLCFTLIGGLFGNLNGTLEIGILLGTTFGLSLAISFGVFFAGGFPVLQHVLLRWLLWKAEYLPRNYTKFLVAATDCMILERVSGGFKFYHRELQQYLAESARQEHVADELDKLKLTRLKGEFALNET